MTSSGTPPHVSNKHTRILRRRAEYLQKLVDSGEANSYDKAELAALTSAVGYVENIKEFEKATGEKVSALMDRYNLESVPLNGEH